MEAVMALCETMDRGQDCEEAGDLEGAAAAYESALSAGVCCNHSWCYSDEEGCAHDSLGSVQQQLAMVTGEFAPAIASFRVACSCFPQRAESQLCLGLTLYFDGSFAESVLASVPSCVPHPVPHHLVRGAGRWSMQFDAQRGLSPPPIPIPFL